LQKGTGVKRALISDIHANLEALRAVLQDIRSQGITDIFCLGDIVGYGPNPCECLDEIINRCEFKTILGNHDQAVLVDPAGFNPIALRAIYWTRDTLESLGSRAAINRRLDFLGELPQKKLDGKFLFVHGSPREHVNEYVFPEDVYNHTKMDALFGKFERYCFQGHTHMPGVFTTRGVFVTPEDCNYEYPLSDEKIMVNVGSVGQPRDGNPQSCYVILTDDRLVYRRVPYDVDTTAKKIYAIPELDNSLGNRIRIGQ
jgi:predicted phosphodiesterase